MGTSVAGGYVTGDGAITPWLNELAFVPMDYRDDAPVDEWSGDRGCAVQYFCQQGVARLAPLAELHFSAGAEILRRATSPRCRPRWRRRRCARGGASYETIGLFRLFDRAFRRLLRHQQPAHPRTRDQRRRRRHHHSKGARGVARGVSRRLAEKIQLRTPEEKDKRHGQAYCRSGACPRCADRGSGSRYATSQSTPQTFSFPMAAAPAEALARVTHLGVGAHQDDLEFMAFHGINMNCYHSENRLVSGGVVCTNGSGSARQGAYCRNSPTKK